MRCAERGAAAVILALLAHGVRDASVIVRRMIGVPDYDAYLAHHARHHGGGTALSREAFSGEMLARRYERPGSRCC